MLVRPRLLVKKELFTHLKLHTIFKFKNWIIRLFPNGIKIKTNPGTRQYDNIKLTLELDNMTIQNWPWNKTIWQYKTDPGTRQYDNIKLTLEIDNMTI